MSVQKNKKDLKKQKIKEKLKPILFIGPHLIFFIVFVVFPFFYGIFISFTKWDLMSPITWEGLGNYKLIFTKGNVFNVDFFIEINGKYIGLQIKPVSQVSSIPEIYKEKGIQLATHKEFTQKYGGKVFYLYSCKSGDKKIIVNTEVIPEIKQEIERISV